MTTTMREPRATRAPSQRVRPDAPRRPARPDHQSQRGHRLAAANEWLRQHAPGHMPERAELPDMTRSHEQPTAAWVNSAWFIAGALIVVGALLCAASQGWL